MTRFIKILAITLFGTWMLLFAGHPIKKHNGIALSKTAVDDPLISRARAYLDKGKLKIAVQNYGRFVDWDVFPAAAWGNFTYIPDVSLMVGIPGKDKDGNPYPWAVGKKDMYMIQDNDFRTFGSDTTYWGPTVSESWMDRTSNSNRVDWESKEESQIYLHNPMTTAGQYFGEQGLYTYAEDQYPLIATSDIPESWPIRVNAAGEDEPFWPGPFALDPSDTSSNPEQLKGVFVSDQDIYFEFNDRFATRDIDTTQGYPIGIRATVSAYSYSASISEDIVFFKMYLHNDSQWDYEGVYGGFYFDGDSYNTDLNGYRLSQTNEDDMMGYNTEQDFGYIYDLVGGANYPETGGEPLAYAAVKLLETPMATEPVDLDDDGFADIQVGDPLGLTGWHWFSWYVRPGAKDGGVNGPFSGDGQTPYQPNKEEIQYKIMAGDTMGITASDQENYFHPRKYKVGEAIVSGETNPRFDSIEGLQLDYPQGLDCVFIMSSGPFSIAAGDSVPFSFAVMMGQDTADLRINADVAQLMYDNNYQGARAPAAPVVTAKEGDREITLYWNSESMEDEDIITGYKDFEGYRIYKSTDNGKTWGTREYDPQSRTQYWDPIAQFDLDNDISGFEPLSPHRNLGSNSGLSFKFTDTDVLNGVEYLYAVCAYDRGFIPGDPLYDPDNVAAALGLTFDIPSLENLLSNSSYLDHIVKVIPHRGAGNTVLENLKVEKLPGTIGNGLFNVEVVSPSSVTGDTYEIQFDSEYEDLDSTLIISGSQTYSILNTSTGDTLIKDSKQYSTDEIQKAPPIYDGISWMIKTSKEISISLDDLYWKEGSVGTYHFSSLKFNSNNVKTRSDYEIRFFTDPVDSVFKRKPSGSLLHLVPFQVWNTVTNHKGTLVSLRGDEWNQKYTYQVYEDTLPDIPGNEIKTLVFKWEWIEPGTVDPNTGETLPADTRPQEGDVLVIPVRKPFEHNDAFRVETDKVFKVNAVKDTTLDNVKVVPNPYIVHAACEKDDFVRKLQFTNLPDKCWIHIFTVAGERVVKIRHESSSDGSEDWDLLTSNRQDAAPGLYVYVVEADNGKKITGKFVLIK